jgi:hypothetical protein
MVVDHSLGRRSQGRLAVQRLAVVKLKQSLCDQVFAELNAKLVIDVEQA